MTAQKKTDTKAPEKAVAQPEPAASLPAAPAAQSLRLSYPKTAQETFGITQSDWIVLTDVIFPNATSPFSVMLALRYCKARNLDVMKKVVNIVPMYSKALSKSVDTIWPGIAEVRITATRTGDYAGRDAEVFGPMVKKTFSKGGDKGEVEVEFPEWCQLTVYKIVRGLRCAFVGPKVFWEEAYATESRYSKAPNEMWNDRRHGQLSKCTEAAALRSAFPEETGGQMTAEEMHGRVIDGDLNPETMLVVDGEIVPPRPKESDFQRKEDAPKPQPDKGAQKEPAAVLGPDGRPEPPPVGEPVQASQQPAQGPQGAPPEPEHVVDEAEDEVPRPTDAYLKATGYLDELEKGVSGEKDLDIAKKTGRTVIDEFAGITDDERDMLRGRFTTIILAEQKRRAGKKR